MRLIQSVSFLPVVVSPFKPRVSTTVERVKTRAGQTQTASITMVHTLVNVSQATKEDHGLPALKTVLTRTSVLVPTFVVPIQTVSTLSAATLVNVELDTFKTSGHQLRKRARTEMSA